MSNNRGESSNAAAKNEFKECLEALDAYFATLAKNDPKKLAERYESYLEIHRMIGGLQYKAGEAQKIEDKHDDKLGKVVDSVLDFGKKILGGNDKGKNKDKDKEKENKSPVSASDILKISLTNLIAKCREHAKAYQGKGGRQAYTTILNQLADVIETEITTPVSTAKLLHDVDKNLINQKIAKCTQEFTLLKKDIDDNYIPVLGFEIKQQGNRFFDKKINVELSEEKLTIASQLSEDIHDFIKLSDKEKPKNVYSLISKILSDDLDHQIALQGTIGKQKRLGDLFTQARNIAKENFPAEYARGKEMRFTTAVVRVIKEKKI